MSIKSLVAPIILILTACSSALINEHFITSDQITKDAQFYSTVDTIPQNTHIPTVVKTSTQIPAGSKESNTTNVDPIQFISTLETHAQYSPFKLCSPLESHPIEELPKIISDPYHPPPPGKDDRHQGVDYSYYHFKEFSTIHGQIVQSVLAGTVAAALNDSFPYGNAVILETSYKDLPLKISEELGIQPEESLYILYAHLDKAPSVGMEDLVSACTPIGAVGNSGNAVVSHLHLETRIGPAGTTFPVMTNYLITVTPEEKKYYLLWRTSGEFRHFDPMVLLGIEWSNTD